MNEDNNVKEFFENSKENVLEIFKIEEDAVEYELHLEKVRKEVIKKFEDYRITMKFMAADAPIAVLCLKPEVEKILTDQGFLRIYDLFDVDFVKIKGLGVARIRHLTTSLDKFFSML